MEIDFLIIGQGIAGTAMAYRLGKEGKRIMLLDQPMHNQSSRVAAGLYNPITGRKMVKTWMAEELFPEIEPFYRELEKISSRKFLYPQKIYRPFLTIEEQNEWMGHSSDPNIGQFIEQIFTSSIYTQVRDPFGGVMLQGSGWVDLPTLLDGMASFFGDNLRIEKFQEELLIQQGEGWNYKGRHAKAVIFCSGMGTKQSRFFSFLPFSPVKGEILEVKQEADLDCIVNRGVFRIPLNNGNVRLGSTYSWHDLNQGATSRAAKELVEKLQELVQVEVEGIIHHGFGIRPATKDRKPFLGKHPELSNVYVFNGFGTKGVSLVPHFSKVMQDFIFDVKPLPIEVDISRYFNIFKLDQ